MKTFACLALAALMFLILSSGCGTPRGEEPVSVLLIIVDTFRADHLGCMGYDRDVTPTLDSLAECGTICTNAQAQSSWTLPSTASILTGLTARQSRTGSFHGAFYGLDRAQPTIQSILGSMGFETFGVFNVVYLSESFGFDEGFDHFDSQGVTGDQSTRRADSTVSDVLSMVDSVDCSRGFFGVVHFYDPHIPYDPPPPYDTVYASPELTAMCQGEEQIVTMKGVNLGMTSISGEQLQNFENLYDGEILFTDNQISRLLQGLRARNLMDNTLIIVTADHGEEFMEHGGLDHGRTLNQEVLHVPLILCGPGVPNGRRISAITSQIDIMPTVLGLLSADYPEELQGRNLLDQEVEDMFVPSSNLLWGDISQASVRMNDLKIIWNTDGSGALQYDLEEDPFEQNPLEHPDSSMILAVEEYWATPPVCNPEPVDYSQAIANQLEALGYVR